MKPKKRGIREVGVERRERFHVTEKELGGFKQRKGIEKKEKKKMKFNLESTNKT